MAKKSQKAKKFKSRPKKRQSILSLILVITALALYMGVVWFFITQTYHSQPLQAGHVAAGQAFAGDDFSKSLDLRIADKATYPSGPITPIQNLGAPAGLNEQTVSFKVTTDHLIEYGLMIKPDTQAPKNGWPVIILCHGYYNPDQYHTDSGYLGDMNFYAQHGFAVIKPDFRGQGLSINQGSPDGAYYSMAYNTDLMSLISATEQTTDLNKADINLWGHSMGAYIAFRAAVLSPQIKNVILLSGPVGKPEDLFSDYMAPSDKDNPVALRLRQAALLKYGTPLTNPQFWNTTAPIDDLKGLKANVQLHVGTDDQVVPPLFSAELDSALSADDKPHQYYVYDGASHGLDEQRPLIWQRSLDVLQQ